MKRYSNDKNAQMLLSLMKGNGIRKVVASPGTTNLAIVGSMQHDDYFQIYSCVDERSAAYMACGLSNESGEAVAIVCTGATASRNYLPALTEAYYRKLPILVIAGSHGEEVIGHLHSQVIDRTQSPKDTVIYKAFINPITSDAIEWSNNVQLNTAMIKLHQHGGGPVLVNIVASASARFDCAELPNQRIIKYYTASDELPEMLSDKIAIFVGSHHQMNSEETKALDDFCKSRNAVVFCDHTSGYQGKYRADFTLVNGQIGYDSAMNHPDLLIHIGEVSGDTYTTGKLKPKKVWRLSPDGEIRDLFRKQTAMFEMQEVFFFKHYITDKDGGDSYMRECEQEYDKVYQKIPSLGFGNIQIARILAPRLPKDCVLHFSIYNSLRSWNFFKLDKSIRCSCNVGGFGIDGACSTLIGASLSNPNVLHYLVVGDLAFFYDLNVLGNRHVGNNVRILLINNGRGIEFRKKDHPGSKFGADADLYISAGGHFGRQSSELVKHYAEDLNFEYLTANDESSLLQASETFASSEIGNKPIILEVFPTVDDEIENLDKVRHIMDGEKSIANKILGTTKESIKGLAKGGVSFLKELK